MRTCFSYPNPILRDCSMLILYPIPHAQSYQYRYQYQTPDVLPIIYRYYLDYRLISPILILVSISVYRLIPSFSRTLVPLPFTCCMLYVCSNAKSSTQGQKTRKCGQGWVIQHLSNKGLKSCYICLLKTGYFRRINWFNKDLPTQ